MNITGKNIAKEYVDFLCDYYDLNRIGVSVVDRRGFFGCVGDGYKIDLSQDCVEGFDLKDKNIYIGRDIFDYPEFCQYVVDHEFSHYREINQIKNNFNGLEVNKPEDFIDFAKSNINTHGEDFLENMFDLGWTQEPVVPNRFCEPYGELMSRSVPSGLRVDYERGVVPE